MSQNQQQEETRLETRGLFNYLDDGAAHSLYRNGKVKMRRDADGSDSEMEGVLLSKNTMSVANGRDTSSRLRRSLTANGFELVQRPLLDDDLDFFDHQKLVQDYYPQCEAIVAQATGARAYAFDHNVRSVQGKKAQRRISGGQQVQEPLHLVHGDYTLTSGPQRLRDLAKPPSGNDSLRSVLPQGQALLSEAIVERALAEGSRFAIINVWRNISTEPVASHPLALCDSQTVHSEDLVVFEIYYQDRIGENYFAKHADRHRWYYYPAMTRDEALLIKQWDSAGPLARSKGQFSDGSDPAAPSTFSFHSAFMDPATPADAPDRQSIEVRCVVLY